MMDKKEISYEAASSQAEYYNRFWQAKKDIIGVGPSSRHVRRNIMKLLRLVRFNSLLDVGCGEGSLLVDIKRTWPTVKLYGADLSQEGLDRAVAKVDAGFCRLDLEKDFVDFHVDLTVCSEVLEHLENDLELIKKIWEKSRYIVVTVPAGKMDNIDLEVGHKRRYSRQELLTKFELAGYNVLRIYNWGFPFYSPLYRAIFKSSPKGFRTGKVPCYKGWTAYIIYQIFKLNIVDKGDRLFALAERSG